ncbi:MAG: hypothetical protein ACRDZN_01750 [Acidimicrobiales bacterium]
MFLLRRFVWFTTGATAGFGGAMWVRRRVLRAVHRYAPEQLQADMTTSARRVGTRVRDAVAEGRDAMRDREAELRSELRPGSSGVAGH